MRVIPALNVAPDDEATLLERLDAVRGVARKVHLDVCDGTFTDNVTWADPYRWQEIAGDITLQVHLLIDHPEAALAAWLSAGAAEIVVHRETLGADAEARIKEMREACEATGASLILAGGITTDAATLLAHRADVAGFLLLTVTPGHAGQEMAEDTVAKVRALRTAEPTATIWVDGGVSEATVAALRNAGATGAVAASAVFNAPDPVAALTALQ